ncbi:spore germination protein GerPC [Niallia sp. Krafla_26]|uniref:spore germination protein GerPC n=1 Tax=Niallia sp. Krafla_26 TaxID=3064703 RepID=UPI003D17F245
MNQDIYQILQSMQAYIYNQDNVIRGMQKKIQSLEKQLSELQTRPPIHIDRMEYKFDQLKVETLEGTLNIGLNPSDLQGIEDYSVPNGNGGHGQGPREPKERMSMFTEIENLTNQYLDENLPTIVDATCQQFQYKVDETYHEFILQDIKRQLPNRIEAYLNQPLRNGQTKEQQKEWIVEQLKTEIQNGVSAFLKHLPQNMNGEKTE